jgi:DDE superfamily endonuclease
MRAPRSRTWGRRGITPVIRVRAGGTGRISVAGLACYRPGHRSRLIYRLHFYRGRKGETKAFTWTEYRDLLIAAHRQLPGGVVVLVWDNLNVHLGTELRAFTGAQAWLRVFRLPAYAPDLNPVEGIWSVLKRGAGQPCCRQLRPPGPGHPARPEEDPVPARPHRGLPHRDNRAGPGTSRNTDRHHELKIFF